MMMLMSNHSEAKKTLHMYRVHVIFPQNGCICHYDINDKRTL